MRARYWLAPYAGRRTGTYRRRYARPCLLSATS